MTETMQIECHDCHYRRSANNDEIPAGQVTVACPRCGYQFRLPPHRPPNSPQIAPESKSSPRSVSRSRLLPLLLVTSGVVVTLCVFFYLFIGRMHSFYLPEEDVTIFKGRNWEPTEEPAPNVPVLVEVRLRKKERIYWGDGSNIGEEFKSVYFFTTTDSSGKLRIPGNQHRVFVRMPWSKDVTETYCYHLGDQSAVPDPEAVSATFRFPSGQLIVTPRDLIAVRQFSYKPATEFITILQKEEVIPLTLKDRERMQSFKGKKVSGKT